jgi:hypothetical protein
MMMIIVATIASDSNFIECRFVCFFIFISHSNLTRDIGATAITGEQSSWRGAKPITQAKDKEPASNWRLHLP